MKNVLLVQVEGYGSLLLDAFVQQDHSLLGLDAKDFRNLVAWSFQMLFGMAINAYVMKDLIR